MCLDGQTVVAHKCRNRMCVNHKHLEMVTHLQNQRRRAQAARA
ncbi:HNH endonuclease [Phaeobacter gallaeciensis]